MDFEIRPRPHDDVGAIVTCLMENTHAPTRIYDALREWMKIQGCEFPDRNDSRAEVQRIRYPEGWKVEKHASTTNYTYLAVVDASGKGMLGYRIDHETGKADTFHRDVLTSSSVSNAMEKRRG